MGKNLLFTAIIFMLFAVLLPQKIYGQVATPSGDLATKLPVVAQKDKRVTILTQYLKERNSPMVSSAKTFVEAADTNDLDWKFVAAIAGLESTFGKHIPYNSYNAWGWGVYGDNVIRFTSFDEGIATVSKGLRQNYINKGAKDVYSIGRIYAASPTWAERVTFLMNSIDAFSERYEAKNLSMNLSLSL